MIISYLTLPLLQVLHLFNFASHVSAAPQNLTTYLLTRYSAQYNEAITLPVFFHEVLNGTVRPEKVALFFEQDIIYGRGFTTLCGNTLNLLTSNLTTPTSKRTFTAIDNLGQTASGLADEGGRLIELREELVPGSMERALKPTEGTRGYVGFMRDVSGVGRDPFEGFVCSWTMGKAFIDIWTNIKAHQIHKPNKIPQLQKMIDYWADPAYIAAIDATGELIDGWYGGGKWRKSADRVFLETLGVEDGFWRSVDEMGVV